jgi:hypothetical protein
MQITPGVKTSLNYHVNHSAYTYKKYQHARTRRELQVLPFITTGTAPLIFLPRTRLQAGKREIKARWLGLRRIINVHETCSTSLLFSLMPTHWALGDSQQSHKKNHFPPKPTSKAFSKRSDSKKEENL